MSSQSSDIVWAAVDWGTSNCRVWWMDKGDAVIGRRHCARGMSTLGPDGYQAVLDQLLPETYGAALDIIVCGMAGSRQGWTEAPYATVPCAPGQPLGAVRAPTGRDNQRVWILPGLKQADPPDVMRGEETQISGFLERHPGWDGVICLPGTHSKWVHVSAGEVVSFRTMMTGEMFALLSGQSVLRHSVAQQGWDDTAFADAVERALSHPAASTGDLFGLRAGALVAGLKPETARARLSGLLIGAELATARPYWLGQRVAILGAGSVAELYRVALSAQGVAPEMADAEEMTLAGLAAARTALREQET